MIVDVNFENPDVNADVTDAFDVEILTVPGPKGDQGDVSTAQMNAAISSAVAAEASTRATEDATLSARMDTFTSLPAGSTSGDAELIDIRVGADGTVYNSAGDAVRGQVSDLNESVDKLSHNNLAVKIINNSYVSVVGVIYAYNGWSRTDYIEIPQSVLSLKITATTTSQYNVFYNSNKQFVTGWSFTVNAGENIISVPNTAKYMMLSGPTANVEALIVQPYITNSEITDPIEVVATDFYLEEADGNSAYLKFGTIYVLNKYRGYPTIAKTYSGVRDQGVWVVKSMANVPDCIAISENRWFCFSFADNTFKYLSPDETIADQQAVLLLGMRPHGKTIFGKLIENSYADQFRNAIMPRYKLTDEVFMNTIRAKEASIVELQTNDTFCFGFLTDLHSYYNNSAYPNLTSLYMNQVDRDINLDAIINGGDTVIHGANDLEKGIASLTIPLAYIDNKQKMLVAKGNHDANGHSASSVTQQEVAWTIKEAMFFSVAQRHLLNDSSVHFGDGVYFYKDYDAQKVRVIVINSCDAGEEISGNYMAVDSLRVCGVRQAQLNWLANTALNFSGKTDANQWHTIVISHLALETVDYNNPAVQNAALLHGLLVAFKNGQNYSNTYTDTTYNGLFTTSINVDYRTQGSMDLVGVFSGHNHADRMVNTGYEQVTTMSGYVDEGMAATEGTGRTYLGVDEMAFDVVTVNKSTKTVNLTRIGCGSDRTFTY